MESHLDETVQLCLPKSACLVLFELLTDSYERWRSDNPDDHTADPMAVIAQEHAQRKALWLLEGSLERTLPELFSSNYSELLIESKSILR
jgi:hypothetical protein